MKQRTLAAQGGFERYAKKTRRAEFLEQMEQVVPWAELCALSEPVYPKVGQGRPPVGVERMLRIYFLQQWFNLSDPAVEEALYDSAALRGFVDIDLGREPVPDETTVCKFRLCLAKIRSGPETNSLHTFLNPSTVISPITGAHVPLRRIVVGPAPPLLSIASKPPPGKSRSPATVGGDFVSVGVDRMHCNFEPMRKTGKTWQRTELTDVTAKVVRRRPGPTPEPYAQRIHHIRHRGYGTEPPSLPHWGIVQGAASPKEAPWKAITSKN